MRPFPSYEDVFRDNLSLHQKHFLPLISVDVSVVYPHLRLWLHFVTTIEPLDGVDLGSLTQRYHDDYNTVGQYAFQVLDGKYAFAGDFRFFSYESEEIFRLFPSREAEIHTDHQRRIASYQESRRGYQLHGKLPYNADKSYDPTCDSCGPFISQLGGEPKLVNWQGSSYPQNRRGQNFLFIGEVQGFSFCAGGIQAILLFYDPDEKIALFRTEWT